MNKKRKDYETIIKLWKTNVYVYLILKENKYRYIQYKHIHTYICPFSYGCISKYIQFKLYSLFIYLFIYKTNKQTKTNLNWFLFYSKPGGDFETSQANDLKRKLCKT